MTGKFYVSIVLLPLILLVVRRDSGFRRRIFREQDKFPCSFHPASKQMNSLTCSKENSKDSLVTPSKRFILLEFLIQYVFISWKKIKFFYWLTFVFASKIQRKGRKKMSVSLFNKLGKWNLNLLISPVVQGLGTHCLLRVQATWSICAVDSWLHCMPCLKGVTFPLLLTGCGSFCRVVHFILGFFFFKKPEINIFTMKFPDFKTLADHVEYLLNNAIV